MALGLGAPAVAAKFSLPGLCGSQFYTLVMLDTAIFLAILLRSPAVKRRKQKPKFRISARRGAGGTKISLGIFRQKVLAADAVCADYLDPNGTAIGSRRSIFQKV